MKLPDQEPAASTYYEWHWGRIWGALLLLAAAIILLFILIKTLFFSEQAKPVATPPNALQSSASNRPQVSTLAPAIPSLTSPEPSTVAEPAPLFDKDLPAPIMPPPSEHHADLQISAQGDSLSDLDATLTAPASAPVAVQPSATGDIVEVVDSVPATPPATSTAPANNFQSAHVVRHALATAVTDREPTQQLPAGGVVKGIELATLYYFTEIRGLTGEHVSHHWIYNGRIIARIPLQVGSDQWRTYSSKRLSAALPGQWRVELRGPQQQLLSYQQFVRQP